MTIDLAKLWLVHPSLKPLTTRMNQIGRQRLPSPMTMHGGNGSATRMTNHVICQWQDNCLSLCYFVVVYLSRPCNWVSCQLCVVDQAASVSKAIHWTPVLNKQVALCQIAWLQTWGRESLHCLQRRSTQRSDSQTNTASSSDVKSWGALWCVLSITYIRWNQVC